MDHKYDTVVLSVTWFGAVYIIIFLIVTFDHFNVFLLNESNTYFKNDPNFWTVVYLNFFFK